MLKALLRRWRISYILVLAVAVLAAGGGWSLAASSSGGTIRACANKHNGALRIAKHCKRSEKRVSWNVQGVPGQNGANGANGANGTNGTNGTNAATNILVRTGTQATGVGTGGTIIIAHCVAGEKATGGGARSDSTNAVIVDSFPLVGNSPASAGDTPDGWWLDVKTTASTADVTPFVVCASP